MIFHGVFFMILAVVSRYAVRVSLPSIFSVVETRGNWRRFPFRFAVARKSGKWNEEIGKKNTQKKRISSAPPPLLLRVSFFLDKRKGNIFRIFLGHQDVGPKTRIPCKNMKNRFIETEKFRVANRISLRYLIGASCIFFHTEDTRNELRGGGGKRNGRRNLNAPFPFFFNRFFFGCCCSLLVSFSPVFFFFFKFHPVFLFWVFFSCRLALGRDVLTGARPTGFRRSILASIFSLFSRRRPASKKNSVKRSFQHKKSQFNLVKPTKK